MPYRKLTSTSLRSIIDLVEKRESLAEQIEAINAQVNAHFVESGVSPQDEPVSVPSRRGRKKRMGRPFGSKNKTETSAVPKSTKRPVSARTAKPSPKKSTWAGNGKGAGKARGSVQSSVFAAIQAAGKDGINLDDLAKKVGSTRNSLNVLLYRSRKKNKSLKKLVKPGVWGWDG